MRTPVCELLDIEFPILAFSHCRDVVAAVTKAGGLGVLGAVAHTPKQLEIDLDWIDEEVKGRPYGLDFIVPAKYAGDDKGGLDPDEIASLIPEEHRTFLDELEPHMANGRKMEDISCVLSCGQQEMFKDY
jgi:hypothetical protein